MIAVSSSGRSFRALAAYLVAGRSGEERDRVAWSIGRNLPTDDPELAARFMRATASQNDRVEKPVYHIALSFDPNDPVDRAAMERVANRVLERLGLAEHQAVIVAHRDREHAHMHILVNRVHPETGLAWERWKDQPLIQQVLREEERALGLREVVGTLAPTSPARERDSSEVPRSEFGSRQDIPATEVRGAEQDQNATRTTRVDQVAAQLEAHERVGELTREQYHAQIDVSAARTRVSQLDAAAERARAATANFDRALAEVYRDPERVHSAYLALTEEKGVAAASQSMREHPEHFGALKTEERSRAFGVLRGEDDSKARAAAPTAAAKGRDAIDALREFGKVAAEVQARRLEDAFTRELRTMYQEPASARASFERVATERGIETAAIALRGRPEDFGAIRPSIREDRSLVEGHATKAAGLGIEAARARAFAKSADAKARGDLVKTEPAASREDAERAATREAGIRRELGALPSRSELERSVANLLDRMSPREVRQLRRTVSAPRLALAMEIRTTIRDVALGRDDDR
ncbi:MAG: relaxase/mobilization nuclease domain-containing protein [Gemmatimonadaceae bacterium]|nr:relaxase/mobilization nuclease domain-containing protein [Gemmatimonadaceae bacterium]